MNRKSPSSRRPPTPPPDPPRPSTHKNAQRLWIVVLVVASVLFMLALGQASTRNRSGATMPLNEVAAQVQAGNVSRITVRNASQVRVQLRRGDPVTLYKAAESDLFAQLQAYGVTSAQLGAVAYEELPGNDRLNLLLQLSIAALPMAFVLWLLWRMSRTMRGNQDQAVSFGRSRARVMRDVERPQVRFTDVAGADEAKEELAEIVEFLREPKKFIRMGARIPKGVLMVGPPGTGKTLMARAVAGEAGVPFFHISGSEFVEMFVGVGASRVRDLFERAKAEAPAIVFIDEIDAVGRQRGAGLGGGHDEREQTLNQMLVEMDGFDTDTNVIVIAATNRADILDPALLRPGRFDRKVVMDAPDVRGRLHILTVHARGKPMADNVDLEAIARITPGLSGADLENLINEAAILAARRDKRSIGPHELQEGMERALMGPQRRSRVISDAQKRVIATHEAGHAVVGYFMEHADTLHKITIVPRGDTGGYVLSLPSDDTALRSRAWFEDTIAMMMGGRAAEEVMFAHVTTGASSDLRRATDAARSMVTQYGMSETLGPRTFGAGGHATLLGRGWGTPEERDYSEVVAQRIDAEVERIVSGAYMRALALLRQHQARLTLVADLLLEVETLDRPSFEALMVTGRRPTPPDLLADAGSSAAAATPGSPAPALG